MERLLRVEISFILIVSESKSESQIAIIRRPSNALFEQVLNGSRITDIVEVDVDKSVGTLATLPTQNYFGKGRVADRFPFAALADDVLVRVRQN